MRSDAARRALRSWKRRNPEKTKADKRAWGKRNYAKNSTRLKEKVRSYRLKTYGITEDELKVRIESQSGKCSICGNDFVRPREPHIDHCHTTGTIRGLLCARCNIGLGYFKDSIVSLQNAINYLKQQLNPK